MGDFADIEGQANKKRSLMELLEEHPVLNHHLVNTSIETIRRTPTT